MRSKRASIGERLRKTGFHCLGHSRSPTLSLTFAMNVVLLGSQARIDNEEKGFILKMYCLDIAQAREHSRLSP